MQSARSFMHAAQRGVVAQPAVRGASSSAATTAQQHIIAHPTHTDEWIVANIQDGGVLFSDQEVDSAAEALGLTQCPKVGSDTSSDSARANELMAVADDSIRESGRRNDLAGREEQHLSALVRMSIRLAHDWEVQSLIMQKFRSDPVLAEEMANIMRKPAGPIRDGLVLGPARATAALCIEELPDNDGNASHDGFMSKIMQRFVRIMVAIRNGVGHGFRALAERLAKVFGGHEPHLEGEGGSRDFVSFIPKQAMMLAALILVVCLAGRGGMPIVRA